MRTKPAAFIQNKHTMSEAPRKFRFFRSPTEVLEFTAPVSQWITTLNTKQKLAKHKLSYFVSYGETIAPLRKTTEIPEHVVDVSVYWAREVSLVWKDGKMRTIQYDSMTDRDSFLAVVLNEIPCDDDAVIVDAKTYQDAYFGIEITTFSSQVAVFDRITPYSDIKLPRVMAGLQFIYPHDGPKPLFSLANLESYKHEGLQEEINNYIAAQHEAHNTAAAQETSAAEEKKDEEPPTWHEVVDRIYRACKQESARVRARNVIPNEVDRKLIINQFLSGAMDICNCAFSLETDVGNRDSSMGVGQADYIMESETVVFPLDYDPELSDIEELNLSGEGIEEMISASGAGPGASFSLSPSAGIIEAKKFLLDPSLAQGLAIAHDRLHERVEDGVTLPATVHCMVTTAQRYYMFTITLRDKTQRAEVVYRGFERLRIYKYKALFEDSFSSGIAKKKQKISGGKSVDVSVPAVLDYSGLNDTETVSKVEVERILALFCSTMRN